jgi:hypothetical protein
MLISIVLIWLSYKVGVYRGEKKARFSLIQIKENLKGGDKI